jgi:hypothetical protein
MILTDNTFSELIGAASLAPSADNMQPWEFRKQGETIEVFCAKPRILPTDVMAMFAWVAIGAAIQNIVIAAAGKGLVASVDYNSPEKDFERAAVIRFTEGETRNRLEKYIALRTTNRCPFDAVPLEEPLLVNLKKYTEGLDGNIHWTTNPADFNYMASMDARSSYIRLSHKPLHDELFDILRFTKKDIEATRFGLTFESLEVPKFAVAFARQLKYWSVNRVVSRLGFDRLIARQLSVKLKKAGALCLITARRCDPVAYMEAGRTMEQFWLAATSEGLSVQPYGVLPQYLTKAEIEPETFLPAYLEVIRSHREPFYSIFTSARGEFPAIVLRIGKAEKQSARSNIRLLPNQIIRSS